MKTYVHLWQHLAEFFSEREMFQAKFVKELKTRFMFNNIFLSENRAFNEIMWKNVIEPDRPKMTIGHMRITSWTPKATNTRSERVTEYLWYFQGNSGCTNVPQQTLYCTACLVRFTVPLDSYNYILPTVITAYAYFKVLITYCIVKSFNRCVFTK